MKSTQNIPDELKDAPLLNKISRENPFRVPDGYFNSLPSDVAEKIALEKAKSVKIIFIRRILQTKYAVAACLLIAALISGVIYFNQNKTVVNEQLALTTDDISSSIYFDDIDESILVEELSQINNESSTDEQAKEIENYLIETQTDISHYVNEL
ncbi:MAG: hypothetical protein ACHQNT_00405 [Bacteroidia bacterium]